LVTQYPDGRQTTEITEPKDRKTNHKCKPTVKVPEMEFRQTKSYRNNQQDATV